MGNRTLLLALFTILGLTISAQSRVSDLVNAVDKQQFQTVSFFQQSATPLADMLPDVAQGTVLDFQVDVATAFLQTPVSGFFTSLLFPDGVERQLRMAPAQSMAPGLIVRTNQGRQLSVPPQNGQHFWGIVEEWPEATVALSVFSDQVIGLILSAQGNFVLSKPLNHTSTHVLYRDEDLPTTPTFSCDVKEIVPKKQAFGEATTVKSYNPENCLLTYVEIEHQMVIDLGGVPAATTYVTGLFNQVTLLYFNDAINLRLHELVVWATPDPYPSTSSYAQLLAFEDALGGNLNGADIGHLIAADPLGGIAYRDVLCNDAEPVAVSNVNYTYENVPVYSWSVEVITHEIGHNIGSRHTHDCAWNGNNTPIEACGINVGYSSGGSCEEDATLPEAGTIMSYCHLIPFIGIDLSLGFHPQPRALIQDRIYRSSCLSPCEPSPEICNDNIDNDFDGLTDCEDPDCEDSEWCQPCEETAIYLQLHLDNLPQSISWVLTDENGEVVEENSPYTVDQAMQEVVHLFCLGDGCYTFTIYDNQGQGLCCGGQFELLNAEGLILAGGTDFGQSSTVTFCDGTPPEVCGDGLDNDLDGLTDCFDPDCEDFEDCQPCEINTIFLNLTFDNYPAETSWELRDENGSLVTQSPDYLSVPNGSTVQQQLCLTEGCYTFIIQDSYGDGLCCAYGNGGYELVSDQGIILASGAEFDFEESIPLCDGAAIEVCGDGLDNDFDGLTDCADPDCEAFEECLPCELNTILLNITFDAFAYETSWELRDENGVLVAQSPDYYGYIIDDFVQEQFCLPDGCYTFTMLDVYGDGMCCSFGSGGYELVNGQGTVIAAGGDFDSQEVVQVCDGKVAEICGDGIDNDIDGLTDCDDPDCDATSICQPCEGDYVTFTINFDGWPRETSWFIITATNDTLSQTSFPDNKSANTTLIQEICLEEGCHTFWFLDSYGDGICCDYGDGSYVMTNAVGEELFNSGTGEFEYAVSHDFCVESTNCPAGTTFLVTASEDYASSSLRHAINCANASSSLDTIRIQVNTDSLVILEPLPTITDDQVTIIGQETTDIIFTAREALFHVEADSVSFHQLRLFATRPDRTYAIQASDAPAQAVWINDCYFQDFEDVVELREDGHRITNNHFHWTDEQAEDRVGHAILITVAWYAENISITNNIIQGNGSGTALQLFYPQDLLIADNTFVDIEFGMLFNGGYNVDIRNNRFENMRSGLLYVNPTLSYDPWENVRIRQNTFRCIENTGMLFLDPGGYTDTTTISLAHPQTVTGQSLAGATIELYTVDDEVCPTENCIGSIPLGTVLADENGQWEINLDTTLQRGQRVAALTTNTLGNTGVFSACTTVCDGAELSLQTEQTNLCAGEAATIHLQSSATDIFPISLELEVDGEVLSNPTWELTDNLVVSPEASNSYRIISAEDRYGCTLVIDETPLQFQIIEAGDIVTQLSQTLCAGGSTEVQGETITEPGVYTHIYPSSLGIGCDSTVQTTVSLVESVATSAALSLCEGSIITLFGEEVNQAGQYAATFTASNGCDSTHTVNVTLIESIETSATEQLCAGESISLFGETVNEAGTYSATFQAASTGCDSTHSITVEIINIVNTSASAAICSGETLALFGQTVTTAGTYSETFTASTGCDSVHAVTVQVLPTITTTATTTLCPGETISLLGETVSDAGEYTGTFTSSNGCDSTHIITVELLTTDTTSSELTICAGASVQIGSQEVSTAGTYPIVYQNSLGCDSTHVTMLEVLTPLETSELINACSGQSVTVFSQTYSSDTTVSETFSSALGCDSTHTITIAFSDIIEIVDTQTLCEGQTLTLFGEIIGEGGTYTNTFTTAEGCDGIETVTVSMIDTSVQHFYPIICSGETYPIFGEMISENGTYTQTFTNENGCDSTVSIHLSILPTSTSTTELTICEGESIAIFGEDTNEEGTYTRSYTGANGCDSTATVALTVLPLPEAMLITTSTCSQESAGTIEVVTSGGSPDYEYQWAHTSVGTDQLTGLSAGDYQVTITDANGCLLELATTVEELELPVYEITNSFETCFGSNDGSIAITSSQEGLQVSMDDNPLGGEYAFDNLSSGTYTLYFETSEGCSQTEEITLATPQELVINEAIIQQPNCAGDDSGSIQLEITGGTGAIAIIWNTGEETPTLTNLDAGLYSVTVTDENGCVQEATYELAGLSVVATNLAMDLSCGDGQVVATANPTDGTPPYTFQWSTNEISGSIDGLEMGAYTLTITDANDCTVVDSFSVPFVEPLQVSSMIEDVSCFGESDGSINLEITGGQPPQEVVWAGGFQGEELSGLYPGEYTYTLSTTACEITSTITVLEPADLQPDINLVTESDGTLTAIVEVTGGTVPYQFAWSTGVNLPTHPGLTPGQMVDLVITDANGCTWSGTITATITSSTSVSEWDGLLIFPNPSRDIFYVQYEEAPTRIVEVEVYDSKGAVVIPSQRMTTGTQAVSVRHLPAGCYLLSITQDDQRILRRVVVLR